MDLQYCATTAKNSGKISEFLTIKCLDFDNGYEFTDAIIFTYHLMVVVDFIIIESVMKDEVHKY